jgi:hypothetical protein
MRKFFLTAVLGASAIAMSAPAAGQQSGLVNVDVRNVLNNLTIKEVVSRNNIPVNVLNGVAANVQVPIGLAANVCGTTVALLSAAGTGAGPCTANAENMTEGQARALANSIVRAAQNQNQ